jgi:hypothetical protein
MSHLHPYQYPHLHVHLHLPQAVEEEDNLLQAVEEEEDNLPQVEEEEGKQTPQQYPASDSAETPQKYSWEIERKQITSSLSSNAIT